MADYKSMYVKLLYTIDNAITDLKSGLLEAEEIYIDGKEPVIKMVDKLEEGNADD